MGWENLVLSALGILAGGGVTAVILNHTLSERRRTREDAERLFAGPLERIAHAAGTVFREARADMGTRPDLRYHVLDRLDELLEGITELEMLPRLPEGFARLSVLYRRLLEAYVDCRLAIRDRKRRGEDASAEAVKAQEIEGMFEEAGRILADASLRIRSLPAWDIRRLQEKLRADGDLISCGLRLLDLEESLEAILEETSSSNAENGEDARPLSSPGNAPSGNEGKNGEAMNKASPGLLSLVAAHEALRERGINLVASENQLSAAASRALGSDLASRYQAEGYGGSLFARRVTEETERLAREVFRSDHALVTSLSGNMCVLAVLFAFTAPGDTVATVPFSAGGYPFGVEKFYRRRVWIPADTDNLEIRVAEAVELLASKRVKVAFLGASFFLFPQPVAEIRRGLESAGHPCLLAYDGSHVLGLIACGEFQDPLREGADILMGSTHKSFFGPQGGIILTNRGDLAARLRKFLELDLEEGIGLVDNPHLNRIAALGVALEELRSEPTYGRRVVENSRALAAGLHARGVPVRFAERGFTASHQVLLGLEPAEGERLCRELENYGIFIDAWGRLGTAEVTRLGMGAEEMELIAAWIAAVYRGETPPGLASEVRGLVDRFSRRPS